ncbi:MAG: MFS transporter, partial [Pseudomonadota bacterium]|nr:MFS transporter [Pseudomonadota bacterium]
SALVARHTPETQRARRFAWLGAMSLLGFLFGPALNIVARWVGPWVGGGTTSAALTAQAVIVLSAIFGAIMMLGQLHIGTSARDVAMMLGECALGMLAVNALLFFTALLDKVPARRVVVTGLGLAIVGLTVLALHRANAWMVAGISLTAVGTGLIVPVIAYRAAGAARGSLGTTMGGVAAAAGLGQTLGAATGGWLFGALAQNSFAWLAVPLVGIFGVLLTRPTWGSTAPDGSRPRVPIRRAAHP